MFVSVTTASFLFWKRRLTVFNNIFVQPFQLPATAVAAAQLAGCAACSWLACCRGSRRDERS